MKKSQIRFPAELAGIPLAPSSRDGTRYCVEFQSGSCREGDSCQVLHRCAAVFKSGRTCHGNHPGSECRNTRKHAISQDVNPRKGQLQVEVKTEEPEIHSQAKRARVSLKAAPGVIEVTDVFKPEYVEDDSIMKDAHASELQVREAR